MNILVLDDEKEIADLVELYLQNENYQIYKFYKSEEAINCIDTKKIDVAILDVMIEGKDGFEICRYIRKKGLKFPVIMLTAKIEDNDKIKGLTLGADDYITKPFNPLELVARVKSTLRRYTLYNGENTSTNIIEINGLVIDKDKHKCLLYEKEIDLTPMEFEILLYLAENRGKVIPSEELFEKVWKEKYLDSNNTVMVHIRRIREKLNEDTKHPKFIKTVWEWDIKLKMNDLTKRKIRLSMSLIANIMVAMIISLIVYFIMAMFFEGIISDIVYFLNCIFYYGYVF